MDLSSTLRRSKNAATSVFVGSRMQILVRSPTGRTIVLRVKPSDTLYTVKAKILEQHLLTFDGVELDDDLTLADYDIQHGSTLDLQEKMQIYVTETQEDSTITLEVNSLDTIDSVKAKIEGTEGFPMGQQCLIFGNKRLEGKRTLADYNICKESAILLVLYPLPRGSMRIFARMLQAGRTITLEVESSDTVDNVKMKIYEKDVTRPKEQRIIYCGKQLEEGRTLADYKIEEEDTIHVLRCQNVVVENLR